MNESYPIKIQQEVTTIIPLDSAADQRVMPTSKRMNLLGSLKAEWGSPHADRQASTHIMWTGK
jgi:hypothetical protein